MWTATMSWAPGPRDAAASPGDCWGSLSPCRLSVAEDSEDHEGSLWPQAAPRSSRSSGTMGSSWDPKLILAGPGDMAE